MADSSSGQLKLESGFNCFFQESADAVDTVPDCRYVTITELLDMLNYRGKSIASFAGSNPIEWLDAGFVEHY